jgi:hypothetical protein
VVICIIKKSLRFPAGHIFLRGGFSMWLDITIALIAIYLLTFTAILIMEAANVI